MRFTAESLCTGPAGSYCAVRILAGGIIAAPASHDDFAFDSAEDGGWWESHSVERVVTVFNAVDQPVIVQVATVGATSFRLDDWTLTSMAITAR